MKFLFVAKQERHAAAYVDVLTVLAERGHEVALAVQEADPTTRQRGTQRAVAGIRMTSCPASRLDESAPTASLIRRLQDAFHYLHPEFRNFPALQNRFLRKLGHELGLAATEILKASLGIPFSALGRLEEILRAAERGLPPLIALDEFLRAEQPDIVLVSPLIHLDPSQTDVVASAQRLGMPVWMLLFSWDNLSTKGCIHVKPDLMFVWNEQQREEAQKLHGYPTSQVIIVGAHRFDTFFELAPAMSRSEFHMPLGLDPAKPTLLYLCSSPLVAPDEGRFLERWLHAVRNSPSDALRSANVVIRPHPAIALLPSVMSLASHRWPAAPRLSAYAAKPFADDRVVVVQTPHEIPDGLHESIVQSTAVIALNTTAELEAGIVGRPVFTIQPDSQEGADHHATVHFHYLTRNCGGFVSAAASLDEHVAELARTLDVGFDATKIRAFIESFLRPHGISRPVLPLFVDALERQAVAPRSAKEPVVDSTVGGVGASAGTHTTVALAYGSDRILVHPTPEAIERVTNDGTVRLDKATVKWLEGQLSEGGVLYDIYSGFGAYALIAAKARGAAVIAFEPDYQTHAALTDNVVLNGCQDAIVTIPLALKDRDIATKVSRRSNASTAALRPFALHRLDTVVENYHLPPPTHVRLSSRLPTIDIIKGGRQTLSAASLRSIWLSVPLSHGTVVIDELGQIGFRVVTRREKRKSLQLVMTKTDAR